MCRVDLTSAKNILIPSNSLSELSDFFFGFTKDRDKDNFVMIFIFIASLKGS
jgi:hypothetical protein